MSTKNAKSAEKSDYYVSTFYKFQKDADPEKTKLFLEDISKKLNVRGLIIIGTEGFNATVCAKNIENLENFKDAIRDYFKVADLFFKDSESVVCPFRRFKVKIRPEIVTLGDTTLVPFELDGKNNHLSPTEWNQVMKNDDPIIIDTRNWYETKIGTFKGAINPMTNKFTEFPKFLEKNNIPKDKKVLIFCTGGIRCEKGILEVQKQGYKNVYQLYGGILNYLKESPNDQFEGECFVFDHRVAVTQNLQPSTQYRLCPHCGQTCSKNCAHHYELHPERKALRQAQPFETEEW
jgi:UPF0176 protein